MRVAVSRAAVGKSAQLETRKTAGNKMETVGMIVFIFFLVLTCFVALTLTLFTIGFSMAVTHWCDRSAAPTRIISYIDLVYTFCRLRIRIAEAAGFC